MRRIGAVMILLLVTALAVTTRSHAAATPASQGTAAAVATVNGFCFLAPYNTLTPCPTTPTSTPAPITPVKLAGVSGGVAGPQGTTSYVITITSSGTCFALQEPILVYLLGNANAAALAPIAPTALVTGSPLLIHVDPTTGTAQLALEVFNRAVGPAGLTLKVVWPQEGLERLVPIIAPRLPPPSPTSTASPVPSVTSTVTPSAPSGGTENVTVSAPGATPTPTPGAAPLTLRVCVSPNPMVGSTTATLYGLTLQGAFCTSAVAYNDGSVPSSFTDGPQVAGSNLVVSWTWTENTTATGGTAIVACRLGTQLVRASTTFTISHPTPVPSPTP